MSSPLVLKALPADPTPDTGPVHRGGPLSWLVALTCGFIAIGAGLLMEQRGHGLAAVLCLVVPGTVSLFAFRHIRDHFQHRTKLPASKSVLAGVLGFEIHCTCRDVAATVFFLPDEAAAGSVSRLLCFVENYASRQRIAVFHFGPHAGLGLNQRDTVSLHLAPGQAGVYCLPLVISHGLKPGEHDLPVALRVEKPSGTGLRLPGTRRHLYDAWTCRFAAPFSVATEPALDPTTAKPTPSFTTLASVSDAASAPLERLAALLAR